MAQTDHIVHGKRSTKNPTHQALHSLTLRLQYNGVKIQSPCDCKKTQVSASTLWNLKTKQKSSITKKKNNNIHYKYIIHHTVSILINSSCDRNTQMSNVDTNFFQNFKHSISIM